MGAFLSKEGGTQDNARLLPDSAGPSTTRSNKRKRGSQAAAYDDTATKRPKKRVPPQSRENQAQRENDPKPANFAVEVSVKGASRAPVSSVMTTPARERRSRRRRKAPTSPYFEVVIPQTKSPPTTPTPSKKRKTVETKSKVSILESGSIPPSLPHFAPTSPDEFGLIQEKLRHDPWRMLVAVIFLNVTTAKLALPLLAQLLERWPTPDALSQGIPK